jgi:hypothetical protein
MRSCLLLFLGLGLTACSPVYEQTFDCPPGEGVPCTSVTDLEALIVETNEGPDIFIGRSWSSEAYREGRPMKIYFCQEGYCLELPSKYSKKCDMGRENAASD